MSLPPGHPQESRRGLICKLNITLYGLKQSPRAWYANLSSVLMGTGYKRSTTYSLLFIKKEAFSTTVVLIYVDDLVCRKWEWAQAVDMTLCNYRACLVHMIELKRITLKFQGIFEVKMNGFSWVIHLRSLSGHNIIISFFNIL